MAQEDVRPAIEFPTWPQMGPEEAEAAREAVAANQMSQLVGRRLVEEFEEKLAAHHGVRHAVAVNTGTSAVHLALASLGVGEGDEVIVPAHTFVASASPVLYQGATPVFADVRATDYCLDPEEVERRVTPRTRAVVAVHLNGCAAPLAELREVCDRRGVALVEDAAQAHCTRYDGKPVGGFGALGCLSFWQDKIITTAGEGGAVLTDDDALAESVRLLRSHGEEPVAGPRRLYHHSVLGYNYRLTAPQAAVGSVQMGRIAEYDERRRRNSDLLARLLADVPGVLLPQPSPAADPCWWKYTCVLDRQRTGMTAAEFTGRLLAEGYPVLPRYPIPLHRQPVFAKVVNTSDSFPVADMLSEQAFSLPVHPAITDRHVEAIVSAIARTIASGA
ncbi:DegT/DnrJ/EryC1/StrS family aminotransferase [Saccharothrix coeruleofusca]|nr:DegT/DnrJ/EryC1/StrS family aminotransferase [Saccharothrix coeruleofusca]